MNYIICPLREINSPFPAVCTTGPLGGLSESAFPGQRADDFMKIRNCVCGDWQELRFRYSAALLLKQENPFPAQLLSFAGSSSQSRRWVGCWKVFQHWCVRFSALALGMDKVDTENLLSRSGWCWLQ